MTSFLKYLALAIAILFSLLLIFGFGEVLGVLRSRITLILVLGPVIGVFLYSVYRIITTRPEPKPIPPIDPSVPTGPAAAAPPPKSHINVDL